MSVLPPLWLRRDGSYSPIPPSYIFFYSLPLEVLAAWSCCLVCPFQWSLNIQDLVASCHIALDWPHGILEVYSLSAFWMSRQGRSPSSKGKSHEFVYISRDSLIRIRFPSTPRSPVTGFRRGPPFFGPCVTNLANSRAARRGSDSSCSRHFQQVD